MLSQIERGQSSPTVTTLWKIATGMKVVTHGKLDMVLNGTKITLGEKQAVRFETNILHSYGNPYKDTCNIYHFIFYKE